MVDLRTKLSGIYRWRFWALIALVLLFNCTAGAQRLQKNAPELRGIDIKEHLGSEIPLDLAFTDESGNKVALKDYFQEDKPVVLTLAYYECPMLCTLVLNGLSKGIKKLDKIPGEDYQLLTVSIDPDETPQLAKAKRDRYLENIGKGISKNSWKFLVGEQKQIKELANAVGFHYFYDQKQDEYAHTAVVFILTDKGVISRYLYGIEPSPNDLKLSLLEAAQGKTGNIIDRILLYCYHYDPAGKKYALMATNVMRLGGVATVLSLGLLVGFLWIKDSHKK